MPLHWNFTLSISSDFSVLDNIFMSAAKISSALRDIGYCTKVREKMWEDCCIRAFMVGWEKELIGVKLKIAICDDETILCKELKEKISKFYSEYSIDTFHSGKELLRCPNEYDMIFLDIEMPGEDGMETAKKLRSQNCKSYIIFLTSHTEYMPDAFKVKAFRFLAKPLDEEHLKEALTDAQKELADSKKIIISNFGREMLADIKDIMYVRADRKSTVLHFENEEIETGYPLKYWMEELGGFDFCQTHKSYLVSVRHIKQVLPEGVMLKITEEIIPLSRRKYSTVKNAFFRYIEEHAGIM